MQETIFIWVIAGFVTAIALRNIFLKIMLKYYSLDDYSRDVNEILTKEEYKVKGRFE